jgi:hypothetical protein
LYYVVSNYYIQVYYTYNNEEEPRVTRHVRVDALR